MNSQPLFFQEQESNSFFQRFENTKLWNSEMTKVRGGNNESSDDEEEEEEDLPESQTSEDPLQKDGFN